MRDPLITYAAAPKRHPLVGRRVFLPAERDAAGWRNHNGERGLIPGTAAGAPIMWNADVATIIHVVMGAHEFPLAP